MLKGNLSFEDLKKSLVEDGDRFHLAKLKLTDEERKCVEIFLMKKKILDNPELEKYLDDIDRMLRSRTEMIISERWTEIQRLLKEKFPYYFKD